MGWFRVVTCLSRGPGHFGGRTDGWRAALKTLLKSSCSSDLSRLRSLFESTAASTSRHLSPSGALLSRSVVRVGRGRGYEGTRRFLRPTPRPK